MPTKAIGTGTVNVNYNAPVDERALLEAFRHGGEAMASALRRLVLKGAEVENAALAEKLKNIRRSYYGVMHVLLAIVSLSALFTTTTMRRPVRTAKSSTVRSVRSRKETV